MDEITMNLIQKMYTEMQESQKELQERMSRIENSIAEIKGKLPQSPDYYNDLHRAIEDIQADISEIKYR